MPWKLLLYSFWTSISQMFKPKLMKLSTCMIYCKGLVWVLQNLQIWKSEVQKMGVFQMFRKSLFESRTFQIFRCVRLACGSRFVTSVFRLDSNSASENWRIWRNFFRFAIRIIPIFLLKNLQGNHFATFRGWIPVWSPYAFVPKCCCGLCLAIHNISHHSFTSNFDLGGEVVKAKPNVFFIPKS